MHFWDQQLVSWCLRNNRKSDFFLLASSRVMVILHRGKLVVIYACFCFEDMRGEGGGAQEWKNESPQRCLKSAESKFELCCFVFAYASRSMDFPDCEVRLTPYKVCARPSQLIPHFISPSLIKYPFVFSSQSLMTVKALRNEVVAVIVT